MSPSFRGDEARVVEAFRAWLEEQGWDVTLEVKHVDVLARRGDQVLWAEAKGHTGESTGTDVDTMYGQILRRMPITDDRNARFAVVVPTRARAAALRVPSPVRSLLRIDVYVIDDDGQVEQVVG